MDMFPRLKGSITNQSPFFEKSKVKINPPLFSKDYLPQGFGIQKLKIFGAYRIGRISEILGRISVELTSQTI